MWCQYILSLSIFLAATLANACEVKTKMGTPHLVNCPKDVSIFVDRALMCHHFAGEINGDRSARDVQVSQQLETLKCETLKADYEDITIKYSSDTHLVNIIEKVIEDYSIEQLY